MFSALHERLMFVHIILSSVWVAEWPFYGERAAHLVEHMYSLVFDYAIFFRYYPF